MWYTDLEKANSYPMSKDDIIKEALGEHVYSRFVAAKMKEWENYSSRVYDWEIDEYLAKF